jgi:hypothetical protein
MPPMPQPPPRTAAHHWPRVSAVGLARPSLSLSRLVSLLPHDPPLKHQDMFILSSPKLPAPTLSLVLLSVALAGEPARPPGPRSLHLCVASRPTTRPPAERPSPTPARGRFFPGAQRGRAPLVCGAACVTTTHPGAAPAWLAAPDAANVARAAPAQLLAPLRVAQHWFMGEVVVAT